MKIENAYPMILDDVMGYVDLLTLRAASSLRVVVW